MKINQRLNFVIPIFGAEVVKTDAEGNPVLGDDGKPEKHQPVACYVHAIPLAAEIVDRYFLIIAQTYSQIMTQGLGTAGGPGHALRMMRMIAKRTDAWDGLEGVQKGLIEEMRRTTSVIVPSDGGWAPVPLQVAVDRGHLDDEDRGEVENAIVFFIAASATLARALRRPILESAGALWSVQISSLSASEFASSLPRSRGTANSGARPHAHASAPAPSVNVAGQVPARQLSVPH